MTDLATTGRQFSQVTNQLQVLTEEAAQLRDNNAKLSQDLEGLVRSLLFFVWLIACSTSHPDLLVVVAGARVIRVGMVTKLAEVKKERNTALLKVIEKEGAIGRLSEQLQSECRVLVSSSPLSRTYHNSSFSFVFSEAQTELEQSQVSREQDAATLSQVRDAQRKSEAIS
jgi:hypothetical protein